MHYFIDTHEIYIMMNNQSMCIMLKKILPSTFHHNAFSLLL